MIFSREEARLILNGRKTQHRRTGKADNPPFKLERQPVQRPSEDKSTQETVCHVLIRQMRWERLTDITEQDARREGHRSRHLFLKAWQETYGNTSHDVWVVEFELDRKEEPRFLARQQGQEHPQQYVGSRHGAIDELEAVDDWTLSQFAKQNEERFTTAADQHIELLKRQLQQLRERYAKQGINVSPETRLIERKLQEIERKRIGWERRAS